VAIARAGTPTTAALTAGAQTLTVSVPAGIVDGNFLLMAAFGIDITADTFTDPAGWTLEDGAQAGTNTRIKVWWRNASGEPASYNVAVGGGSNTKYVVCMAAYSGVNATTPFSAHSIAAETVAQTTHTTNAIVPGSANDWLVSFFGDRSTTSASKNTNWTPTSPAIERAEVNNNTAASSPWCALELNDSNGVVGSTASISHSSTSTISQANALMWIGSLNPAAAAAAYVPYDVPHSPQHQAVLAA
jgi:hypothetical protein